MSKRERKAHLVAPEEALALLRLLGQTQRGQGFRVQGSGSRVQGSGSGPGAVARKAGRGRALNGAVINGVNNGCGRLKTVIRSGAISFRNTYHS